MGMIYSEADAALLEAQRMTATIYRRYTHAVEELLPEGERRGLLAGRIETLKSQSRSLEATIRDRELLPRDAETELSDLQQLGDRFRSWIDEAAADALLKTFAEQERALAHELKQAQSNGIKGMDDLVDAAETAAQEMDPGAG